MGMDGGWGLVVIGNREIPDEIWEEFVILVRKIHKTNYGHMDEELANAIKMWNDNAKSRLGLNRGGVLV